MPWYKITQDDIYEEDGEGGEYCIWDGMDFEQNSLSEVIDLYEHISVGLFKTALNSLNGLASIAGREEAAVYSLLELGIVIQIKYGLFLTKNKV